MFLGCRSTQAEFFDAPDRTPEEVARGFRELARMNRVCQFTRPFDSLIPRLLGEARCRSLILLDLGAGDGSLGAELTRRAAARGWNWRVTNLDLNPLALRLNAGARNVAGSALALPFSDESFDVVIASQMTHHLTSDADVTRHFREAWRVARGVVVLSDLHRNAGLLCLVWLWTRALRLSPRLCADGVLSVRRGFHAGEWRALAGQAGISNAEVSVYAGARIVLHARKPAK
ncbi:MAG: methyltransferase domain-containing protein [Verrucomicrobia bacterium]|nr:methyltransferase domain-containing protein [Verrucomicrobiota bacterium]